ncbi:MAG: hypothetical protein QM699_08245 [Amaricoccus sp.]|uniref:hypothetical protein n=1 Tax=Amaricoccus sp. TaxID=1872485 RepID=UPI0039E423E9
MSRHRNIGCGDRGRSRVARVAAVGLVLALAGCAQLGAPGPAGDGALELSFEDAPAPQVFQIEAPAVRDAKGGAEGMWAAVHGLARPERAEAVNLANGRSVDLALYRAGGKGPPIRLSNAAAEALGIGDDGVNVRITALRRRPVVDTR